LNYIHYFQKKIITIKNFFQVSIFVDHSEIVILIQYQKIEINQNDILKYYYSQLKHTLIIFYVPKYYLFDQYSHQHYQRYQHCWRD
jgi:hypothetical protein